MDTGLPPEFMQSFTALNGPGNFLKTELTCPLSAPGISGINGENRKKPGK
ncbi:hypothetical protein ACNPN0_00440 [Glutamicibacter sp. AGC84]